MLGFDAWRDDGPQSLASPDDGRGFSERAAAAFEKAGAAFLNSSLGSTLDSVTRDIGDGSRATVKAVASLSELATQPEVYRRVFDAAWNQTTYVDTLQAREAALQESFEQLRGSIKGASGIDLPSPWRGGYREEALRDLSARFGPDMRREVERNPALVLNAQISAFNRAVDDLSRSDPRVADAAARARIDHSADMIMRRADEALKLELNDRPLLPGLAAAFAGSIVPAMKDPINAAGLFLGAGPSAAKTVVGRVLEIAAREAGINAGITALQQPFVQSGRQEAGLEAGLGEAAKNVALAAAIGGTVGGGVAGVRELNAAIKAGRVPADPVDAAALRGADASDAADAVVMAARPEGLSEEEAALTLRQAVAHADDPVNNPPPDIPIVMEPARADRAAIMDENLPTKPGDIAMVDDKPVGFSRLEPGELTTDALTFQYKGGGDMAGVTDRLRSVTRWDPLAAGRVFAFERLDGQRIIADGHQRLGLARRLQEQGQQDVYFYGHVFREADGWTPADVRALAAKKNMQEGSGTALDAARVLRDRPDLNDGALPVSGPMMRQAVQLSRLSDEAFAMVNAGVVPEAYGARVGAMVMDPLQHVAVMNDLIRFKPESEREASILIGESLRAGFVTETQADMFGQLERSVSLMAERVRVLNDAVKMLASDKALFSKIANEAERIEAVGNRLVEGNAARAEAAAQMRDILVRLAQRRGPVSDALNEAAAALQAGGKPGEASRQFLDATRALMDRDGLARLLQEPELRPATVVEPGTPQALELAERAETRDDMTIDMFGGAADAAPARASEATAAGDQLLIDGVRPVTDGDRMALEAARPLQGGDAPPGGLFDDGARAQSDLLDAIPLESRDSTGTRLVSKADALAEAERTAFHADLIKACKS